ncbi:hypothetical protein ACIQ57_09870 [Lysinibacillus xylanilyticus]|uniref:hypothetical protein n=1 Tax=Lysinibacillus xylanilyticus TaxID=582475 RepID=UPI0037FE0ADB
MSEIYSVTIFAGLGLIILISIIVHFLMKKRTHKDFYLVIIVCGFFMLCSLYLFVTGVIDITNNNLRNYQTAEGNCEIVFFEESSSRFGSNPSYYNIYIDGLNIIADGEDFSFLKEETVACKVTYLAATDTLVEIQIK